MPWLTVQNALLLATALPLAGFLVLAFWGHRFGRRGAATGAIATAITAGSFGLAILALVLWVAQPGFNLSSYVEAYTYPWIALPATTSAGAFSPDANRPAVTIGCLVDSLTIAAFVLVTLIAVLVHLFTLGGGDSSAGAPRQPRFYAFLQLLSFAMLGFLLSNSLIQMLFFWEWIGIAAWLLVGLSHDQEHAARPALRGALRMFLMNAAGDAAFLAGIGILAFHTRSLSGLALFDTQGASILSASVRSASQFHSSEFLFFTGNGFLEMHWLTWAGIAFLIAALARMAQFPFQPWAHQAAEASPPVSAMLQGAVAPVAGIYLLARVYPILTIDARFITAIIGCVTLLSAALIAIVQTDVRKILAWSTVSQAGYMLLFLGAGGYVAGILQLFTHAFFKTALVLAAGSLLFGFPAADLRQMGGLWRRFPFTAAASLVGVLALAGAPWLSGAYSTNLGLAVVYDYAHALQGASAPTYELFLFWIPALTTYLTALGIGRWWWLIFAGENRNPRLLEKARESPFLTLPVIILAGFSVGHWFDYLGITSLIAKSIPPTLSGMVVTISDPQTHISYAFVLRAAGWSFLGLAAAALAYLAGLGFSNRIRRLPGINALDYWLGERMFFDVLYEGLFLRLMTLLSQTIKFLDRLLDALVKLVGSLASLLVLAVAALEPTPLPPHQPTPSAPTAPPHSPPPEPLQP